MRRSIALAEPLLHLKPKKAAGYLNLVLLSIKAWKQEKQLSWRRPNRTHQHLQKLTYLHVSCKTDWLGSHSALFEGRFLGLVQ